MNSNSYLVRLFFGFIALLLSVFTPKSDAALKPVKADNPMVVDGSFSETQWANAATIEDFVVVRPDNGAAPKHKTLTRVLYNAEGLYFAISNFQPYDTQIERLTSRDNNVERDSVRIVLDTSGKGSYGYLFNVGLGGSLIDGTVQPERTFAYEWNAPWLAQTQRHDDRWDAEIFIPWSALKLPSATDQRSIGLSVERRIAYLSESWAVPALGESRPVFLSGLLPMQVEAFEAKSELTFVPYFSSSVDVLNKSNDQNFGFDLYYQPTTDSQVSLTVSPDFGLVENDEIVVNFSAFETFVPEKRDFFLEGQEIFNPKGAMMINTRRIGAAPDAPIPEKGIDVKEGAGFSDILAAGKYTGQTGNVRYGVLSAIEDDTTFALSDGSQTTVEGRKFMAVRTLYENDNDDDSFMALGYLGTTTGHYYGSAQTHMFDGEYRTSDDRWQFNGQFYYSNIGDVKGFGQYLESTYMPESGHRHYFRVRHIDRNLELNDMGFLARNDINNYHYGFRMPQINDSEDYKSRRDGGWFDVRTNNDGERISTRLCKWYGFQFNDLTRYNITFHYTDKGWNDRNSRGFGSYRTNGYFTLWQRWRSDTSQAFSYGVAGYVKQAQISGTERNIRPFVKYTPTENISIDASLQYKLRHNWQLWQEKDRIDSFDSKQINMTVKSTWIMDDAQEVRIAMQWVGLNAESQKSYRINGTGDLYASGEAKSENFNQGNLAFQLRYKYQFAPLSDLYIVYSRGGSTWEKSNENQQGFGGLFSDSFEGTTADQLTMKVRYRF